MGKRTSSTSPEAAAVKVPKVDPRECKCQEVISALRQSRDLPAAVCDMLCETTPLSMKTLPAERHDFQQGVTAMVGAELAKMEKGLARDVEEAEEKLAELGREKESRGAAVDELVPKLEEQQAQMQAAKHALAADATVFRDAKDALANVVDELRAGGEAAAAARCKVQELEAALAELVVLRDGTSDLAGVPEAVSVLVPRLQHLFQLEDSLATALPSALAKAPASRGAFDATVIAQLEEQARQALEALAAEAEAAEAAEGRRAEAAKAAEEALAATRPRQRRSAEAFAAARRRKEECEAALEAARHWLKSTGRFERLKRERALGQAQASLQEFRDGPLAAFKELCDEVVAPAPTPQEAAKVVDEQADPADEPMAAAGGA